MSSAVGRLFSFSNIKEFYAFNSETLVKRCVKSKFISLAFLAVEQYNYLALSVNQNVKQQLERKDYRMGQIGYISWANVNSEYSEFLIYIQLALNLLIISLILIHYITFSIQRFEFKKDRLLSILIQTYNFQFIPGIYFSIRQKGALGYLNLLLCLLITIIYIQSSNNTYYKSQDFSSRKKNNVEFLKLGVSALVIITLDQINLEVMYIVPLLISLLSIGQIYQELPYYYQPMNQLYVSFSLFNLFASFIFLIHIHKTDQLWLIQGLLFSFPLAFKFGNIIHQFQTENIFNQTINSHRTKSKDIFSIEFVSRQLLSYQNNKKSQENDKSIMLSQIENTTTVNNEKKQNVNLQTLKESEQKEKQFLIDSIFSEREFQNVENLNNFICTLYENYFNALKVISINDFGYLFYLLEVCFNYPKLLVTIAYIQHKKGISLSLEERSALNYLLYSERKNNNAFSSFNSNNQGQISQGSSESQSNFKFSNHQDNQKDLDLNQIFIYEDKLSGLTEKIVRCTQAKMEILKCIGQDKIHLQKLRDSGNTFYNFRSQIEKSIFEAIESCGQSIDLEILQQYFCDSLCQDQQGFQEKLKQAIRRSVYLRSAGNSNRKVNLSSFKRNLLQKNFQNDFNSNFIVGSGNFCVVFVSLKMDNLGRIKMTSNQFRQITGFTREEVVGQNISILQPQFIGEHHNQYLKDFTERGYHSERSIQLFNQSLFLRRKDGFCISIELMTQMHINQVQNEAGLIGQISYYPGQQDQLIVFDINSFMNKKNSFKNAGFLVDTCSEKLFYDMFSQFCDTLHSIKRYTIQDFIPIFSNFLVPKLNETDETIKNLFLTTIAFFPKSSESEYFNPRTLTEKQYQNLQDPNSQVQMIQSKKRKRNYDIEQNDIYLVDICITIFNDPHKEMRIGIIKFRTYRLLENEDEIKYMLELNLAPQLEEMCGYNREDYNITQFLNRLTKNNVDITANSQTFSKYKQSLKNEDSNHQISLPQLNGSAGQLQQQTSSQSQQQQQQQQQQQHYKDSTILELLGGGQIKETENNLENNLSKNLFTHNNTLNHSLLHSIKNGGSQQIRSIFGAYNSLKEQQLNSQILLENPENTAPSQIHNAANLQVEQLIQMQSQTSRRTYNMEDIIQSHDKLQFPPSGTTREMLSQSYLDKDNQPTQSLQIEKINSVIEANNHSKNQNYDLFVKGQRKTANLSQCEVSSDTKSNKKQGKMQMKQQSSVNKHLSLEKIDLHSKTGSKSSSTLEVNRNVKKTLIQKIKNNNHTPIALVQMKFMVVLFLFSTVLYVLINQLELRSLFAKQKRAFQYITWVMNLRNTANSVSKELIVGTLTNYKDIQNIPDDENLAFRNKQLKKANQLLVDFGTQLQTVLGEPDSEDLVVLQELLSQKSVFSYYSSLQRFQNYTQYILYHVFLIYEIQWERIANGEALPIFNYDQNFSRITTILMTIQQLQTDQVNNLHDKIFNQVNVSLIVISLISSIIFIDIIIVFALIQGEVERILKLFATFDSEQIQELIDIAQESLKILLKNLTILRLNGSDSKQSSHFKEISQLQRLQCQKKKKKISSTTNLPKFNVRLLVASIIILAILIVQPIANILFTNQQIKQSEIDSKLLGEFELVRATVVSGQVIPFFFVDKIYYPQRNTNPDSFYLKNLPRVFPLGSSTFKNLTDAIQIQREKNNYARTEYENFFFKILIDNACTPLKEFKDHLTGEIEINECLNIQKNLFKNGLLTGLQNFADIFVRLRYVLEVKDLTARAQQLKFHFADNTLNDVERCYEIILILFSSLKNFIVRKNQDFFSFIQDIQLILMSYELVMIFLTFIFFFVQYLKIMQRQLRQAILILSVFEINAIFANSYILHFLQQI